MPTTPSTLLLSLCGTAVLALASCEKKEDVALKQDLSAETISQVKALGFSTRDAKAVAGGVLVEGDIVLTKEVLAGNNESTLLRVGTDEQYRTINLVTGLPRTITVSVSATLPSAYVTAADVAIRRFNDQNLRLTFRRVAPSAGAAISLVKGLSGVDYLALAGTPYKGKPYHQVELNSDLVGTKNASTTIASLLAHEIGHCIGFRHTDYANRAYSCDGEPFNEGAGPEGAIRISGTPAGNDPNSWMLSCINSGQNRPFNSNDIKALNYLY